MHRPPHDDHAPEADPAPTGTNASGGGAKTRIFLKDATGGGRFVETGAIVAIFSAENYSLVLLLDGERRLIRRPLQAWEQELPLDSFHRVHRTVIANLAHLERIERGREQKTLLYFRGLTRPLSVSRRRWKAFKSRVNPKGGG